MTNRVLIIAEHQGGKLSRLAWEATVAGQRLARDYSGAASAVILGNNISALAAELAAANLAEVIAVESPLLDEYTPDGYTHALREIIRERSPACIVTGHSYQARDFAPKLAAALGSPLISDCLGYRIENGRTIFTRPVFQGKFEVDAEAVGNPLVSFQAGAFRQDAVELKSSPAKVTVIQAEMPPGVIRTKPGKPFREARQSVDLTQAEIIVAAGRGIKAEENLDLVRKLADALGAEVGASRPICDGGWLPMDRQIGSSGQTVAPKLYVALGISGAIQHQVGMKGARTIVAINKDPEAPIFEISAYGVVGDLFEVVPPLIEEIKKIKAG
ncbi:MAG: electron transfer flavoprotein subunit alpha/FixB family protein [Acidobacteriota bacterium]|nr:electron transfer flavoprotein subunit alpha/FixB family protein [Acidobacteriota bacterium]